MTIFRKKLFLNFHHSSAFIYKSILILCHTNVKYDGILDNYEFERSRTKVKFTVAFFFLA